MTMKKEARAPAQVCAHLTPQQHHKVSRLIGNRCMVLCCIEGKQTEALWDTGSQIFLLSRSWLHRNLPNVSLRPIQQLLNETPLDVRAANLTPIPFDGWIEAQFSLSGKGGDLPTSLLVPMLVTSDTLAEPIIGYNVIERISKDYKGNVRSALRGGFPRMKYSSINALVNLLHSTSPDNLCTVRVGKKDVLIPRGTTKAVSCIVRTGPVRENTPVLFEPNTSTPWPEEAEIGECIVTVREGSSSRIQVPVTNRSQRDVSLRGRTVLGVLQQVRAVLPCSNKRDSTDDTLPAYSTRVSNVTARSRQNTSGWTPPVDLSHLTDEQILAAEKMLKEEAGAFAKDDQDMGCIKNLKMNIQLHDDKPVQKSYISVPRPLFKEVKEYLQDLMARGWIAKSKLFHLKQEK